MLAKHIIEHGVDCCLPLAVRTVRSGGYSSVARGGPACRDVGDVIESGMVTA